MYMQKLLGKTTIELLRVYSSAWEVTILEAVLPPQLAAVSLGGLASR